MRKLEIKFHEFYEQKMAYVNRSAEDAAQVKAIQDDLDRARRTRRADELSLREKALQEEKAEKVKQKNKKKELMMKSTGKREMGRSNKPELNNQKVEKPVIDQDELDMMKFLGMEFTPEMRAQSLAI